MDVFFFGGEKYGTGGTSMVFIGKSPWLPIASWAPWAPHQAHIMTSSTDTQMEQAIRRCDGMTITRLEVLRVYSITFK
jgi:hypothetical protein